MGWGPSSAYHTDTFTGITTDRKRQQRQCKSRAQSKCERPLALPPPRLTRREVERAPVKHIVLRAHHKDEVQASTRRHRCMRRGCSARDKGTVMKGEACGAERQRETQAKRRSSDVQSDTNERHRRAHRLSTAASPLFHTRSRCSRTTTHRPHRNKHVRRRCRRRWYQRRRRASPASAQTGASHAPSGA